MYTKLTIAVPLIGGLLFIFVMSVLIRTACTDPGILPRSEKDEVLFNERQALIASRYQLHCYLNKISFLNMKNLI